MPMPKVAVYTGSTHTQMSLINCVYTTFEKNDIVIILHEAEPGTTYMYEGNPYFKNARWKVKQANFSLTDCSMVLCYSPSSNDLYWIDTTEVEVLTSNLSTRL